MGEVFLADDPTLGRRVAIKQVATSAPERPGAFERLLREAHVAAQLNHPGIAALYDVFEHEGRPVLVMEYVPGNDLAALLKNGPLPWDRAVEIGIDLADALAVAHAHGVIHRDLKPANVRVTPEGRVKILDFGISKRLVAAEADAPTVATPTLTRIGDAIGTPGYSPPEQLMGRTVDARADIFSLGALLYELATGQPPFQGPNALMKALASLHETAPRADQVNPNVPAPFATFLEHAMARDPQDRPASAQAFKDALIQCRAASVPQPSPPPGETTISTRKVAASIRRRVVWAATAALLFVLGSAFYWWHVRSSPPAARVGGAAVVAVLRPENLTGDASNDFLAVGFADSLYNDLAGLAQVTVVPPSEIREAEARSRDVRQLARSLGAQVLLASSVQRSGDAVRVNARLTAGDGSPVWSDHFEGAISGLFDLQRRLAEGVVDALKLRLSAQERSHLGPTTTTHSVDALTDYWRGRTLLDRADLADHVDGAVSAFEAASQKDGALAEALAGLGEAYWARYGLTRDAQWATRAVEASERALALDDKQARVWVTLALVHVGTGQSERAQDDLRRAIALQPSSDDAYRLLGDALAQSNQTDQAVEAYRRAIALRPGYWRNHYALGRLFYDAGRLDAAQDAFGTVATLQPDTAFGYQGLGAVLQTKGDLEGARRNFEKALEVAPSRSAYSNLATIFYWEGKYEEAARAYRSAIEKYPAVPLLHRNLGDALTRLGDVEGARASYGVAVSLLERELAVNPKAAESIADLAVCEVKLGHVGRAQDLSTQAAALAPGSPDVLYSQAVVTALSGRPSDAWRVLERALAAGASVMLVERDDDLASVRALPSYRELRAARSPSSR